MDVEEEKDDVWEQADCWKQGSLIAEARMRGVFAVEDNRASDDRRRWNRRSSDVGVIMDGWMRAQGRGVG